MAARNHAMAAAAAMGSKRQCAEPALQVQCTQWVAAPPGRFLRCGSSEMSRIDYDAAPRIRPGGARNATHANLHHGLLGHEAVPDAVNGEKMPRDVRIGFEFLS